MEFVISKKYEKVRKEIKQLSTYRLKFGVVDDKKEVDGVLVIDYMNWNETGTSRVPARPFFRKVLFQERVALKNKIKFEIAKVMEGKQTGFKAFERIGIYLKTRVEESILSGNFIPNAPSTQKIKGGNNPLIGTGTGLKTVGYIIYKGDRVIRKNIGGRF